MSQTVTTFDARRRVTSSSIRRRNHRRSWLRQRSTPELTIGLILLIVIVVTTLLAPVIAGHEPNRSFPGMSLLPPQSDFWLGTDAVGRDVMARVLYGGRVSLRVAIPSVALALALGVVLGLPAGYFGGRADQVIMRILDIFFAFPAILLAIVLVSILGPSIRNLIFTIGIIYMPRMARIVRAPTIAIKERDFVEAARAMGGSDLRIISRHVLPNAMSPVIVETSLALGQVIITETALSFLGLGSPPPDPTWGAMLSESRQFMSFAPWGAVGPGIAIALTVAAFLMIGHGLRTALDPRHHRG